MRAALSGSVLGLLGGILLAAGLDAQNSLISVPRSSTVAERLERVTQPLLGARYLLSPLGEGETAAHDPDPRVRRDAFDCTTFVETAMALALVSGSDTGDESLLEVLDQLRYSAMPTFERRRHFMAAQWLPDLVDLGQIEDIADLVGGDDTRTATMTMTPEGWRSRQVARDLELPETVLPFGEHSLRYVPLEKLAADLGEIPPGSLLNVVREPVAWAPVLISHQALLLERGGVRVVRHASASLGRVADQTPEDFVRILRQERSRPVIGLSVYRVTLAGAQREK